MTLYFSDGAPATEDKEVGDVNVDLASADGARLGVYTKSVGTKQVETATVIGTIGASGQGNATVVITCTGMTGSPKTKSVAVANNDTAAQVATKIAIALDADTDFDDLFDCAADGANIIATANDERPNIANFNISIDNGTCSGLTAAPTSAHTTAGVEEDWGNAVPVCHAQIRSGPGAPLAVTGQNGDIWHDTAADEWYGPKAAGAWGDAATDIEA